MRNTHRQYRRAIVRDSIGSLLLLLLPFVAPLAPSVAPRPCQQQQLRQQSILLFGDSLTAGQVANRNGEFSPPGLRLRKLLRDECGNARGDVRSETTAMLPPAVTVEGKPLESVRKMSARLEALLSHGSTEEEGCRVDTVVVMGGTNDLWRLDAKTICRNLEQCFETARKHNPNVRCGHVTLPPFSPSVVSWFGSGYSEKVEACRKEVNVEIARMAEVQASNGAFLVDVAAMCAEGGGSDGNSVCGRLSAPLRLPDGIHFDAPGYCAIGEEIFRCMMKASSKVMVAARGVAR